MDQFLLSEQKQQFLHALPHFQSHCRQRLFHLRFPAPQQHDHELTQLEDTLEGVKNYSIAVKEKGEDIIFLRKIIPGGTDESYGVHVARLAGVPKAVTQRANEILKKIERKNVLVNKAQEKEDKKQVTGQLDLYNFKLAEIAHELDKVNVNELTPIEALNTLVRIKEEIKG